MLAANNSHKKSGGELNLVAGYPFGQSNLELVEHPDDD